MKSPRARLRLEKLESRLAPAGNVRAVFSGGSLSLIGDGQANAIAVSQTAADSFTITSDDGTTTINGAAGPLTFTGVTRDLRVSLAGGDDRFRVGEFFGGETVSFGRDLLIDLGAGDNAAELFAAVTVAGDLTVSAQNGADLLDAFGTLGVGDDVTVSLGAGDNTVNLTPLDGGTGTVGGDLRIVNGFGSQSNSVADTNVGGDVSFFNAGAGAAGSVLNSFGVRQGFDRLTVGGGVSFLTLSGESTNTLTDTDVARSVLISTAPDAPGFVTVGPSFVDGNVTVGGGVTILAFGQAEVTLGNVPFGAEGGLDIGSDLLVLTGGSDDTLNLTEVTVGRSSVLLTGGGADAVNIDDATFTGSFLLTTGAGADTVRVESQLTLALEGATEFNGPVLLDLGQGDDSLQLGVAGDPARAVRASRSARFDGGAGSDLRDDANLTRGTQPVTFTSFERAAPPPVFLGPTRFAVGNYVLDLVTADFNADGRLDLATVNQDDRTISVLLGNGDGTFSTAGTFATGRTPQGLAAADFNADGKLDLVVGNNVGSGTVSVLLGNGDGTFAPRVSFPVGAGFAPNDVAVGDFNGDGRADIVTANRTGRGAAAVSVLLGNGDGTFAAPSVIDLGMVRDGSAVAVGDVNGDGRADVVATTLGAVAVLLGNGDGTFAAPLVEAQSPRTSVTLADLNGDNRLDLVLGGNDLRIKLGNGDGTFGAETVLLEEGTAGVTAGDFNRDGKVDVVAAHFAFPSDAGSVFLGNGDGTFRAALSFSPGLDDGPVVAGDFNGDGFDDLAVGNQEFASVSILLNSRRVS